MKKIIASASLAAIGAASLQAAGESGLSGAAPSKPWNVSATLRGFYDDNYATRPAGPMKKDSFGFEVKPSASLRYLPTQRTMTSLTYEYGMRYYEGRERNTADHSHQANARLEHSFTEKYKLDLSDSFVVAQEPELIDPQNLALKLRADGNNIRNTASAKFFAELTRLFAFQVGYNNTMIDYAATGPSSYSALLDRIEHLANFDTRWHLLPQLVTVFGYQFGVVDHTSKDQITGFGPADTRDNRSHYFYTGVDQTFTQQLLGSIRVGAQYTEFINADKYTGAGPKLSDDSLIPYADVRATYIYAKECNVSLGVRHSRVQTDLLALDQEATSLYGSITHKITAKLTGNATGQIQLSTFNQGVSHEKAEQFYTAGLNIAYQFNQYLSAETGYNFDRLDSDIGGRGFTRNRVYLGVRASY